MTGKNLSRRLERLEASLAPASAAVQVVVAGDGGAIIHA
jgi:hypothetical protein